MKTLYDYLKKYLDKTEPYPVIDHKIRASKRSDGTIEFYIHADGVDSNTLDFIVQPDGRLVLKKNYS